MPTGLVPEGAKALLFDIDGTLLDSSGQRVQSWQEAAGKHGLSISKAQYLAYTGMKGRDIVDKLCSDQGVELSPEQRQDVVDTESAIFQDKGLKESAIFQEQGFKESAIFQEQGLKEAQPVGIVMRIIEEGRARQLPMGVVSGGEPQVVEKMLGTASLGDAFKVVVSSKDVEHAKPAPDVYLLAAERLGVEPGACVAYEDAPLGLESARRAGYLGAIDVTASEQHPEHAMKDGRGGGVRPEVEGLAGDVM
ncbi:MAG: HAD-like domain-containing protein [Monoraphidium minutum]|nr:MAG: HAD-like domain-containing protein [Monoraphidium minutum]